MSFSMVERVLRSGLIEVIVVKFIREFATAVSQITYDDVWSIIEEQEGIDMQENGLIRPDKWEFYKDKADEWRWRRTASNGEIVGASTEGYHNLEDCLENAERSGYESGAN